MYWQHTLAGPVDVAGSRSKGIGCARPHVRSGRRAFIGRDFTSSATPLERASSRQKRCRGARVVESLAWSGAPVSSLEIAETFRQTNERSSWRSPVRASDVVSSRGADRGVASVRGGGEAGWQPDLRRSSWHLRDPLFDHRGTEAEESSEATRRVVLPASIVSCCRSWRPPSSTAFCPTAKCWIVYAGVGLVCRVAGCFGPGRRDGGGGAGASGGSTRRLEPSPFRDV